MVHGPLQASNGAGSGALNKAELMQRIMLAQLQSAVYKDIAVASCSDGPSVLGLHLPGLTHAAMPELSPGQCFLYEDSMGSGLPSVQERRCVMTAWSVIIPKAQNQVSFAASRARPKRPCRVPGQADSRAAATAAPL